MSTLRDLMKTEADRLAASTSTAPEPMPKNSPPSDVESLLIRAKQYGCNLRATHESLMLVGDLAAALRACDDTDALRALLQEANTMLAEAITCGPKLREYTLLRQRINEAMRRKEGQ